jgi:hypothetical protein
LTAGAEVPEAAKSTGEFDVMRENKKYWMDT